MDFHNRRPWASTLASLALAIAIIAQLADGQSIYVKMDSSGTTTCNYGCYSDSCVASQPCLCFSGSITITAPLASLPCAMYFAGDVAVTSLILQPSVANLTVSFTKGQWKSGSLLLTGASSLVTLKDMSFPDGTSVTAAVSTLAMSNVSMGASDMTLTTPSISLSNFSSSGQIIVSQSDVALSLSNANINTNGTFIKAGFLRNAFSFNRVKGTALVWLESTYAPSSLSFVNSDLAIASSSSTTGAFFSSTPSALFSANGTTFRNDNVGQSATIFRSTSSLGALTLSNSSFVASGADSRLSLGPSFPLTGLLSIADSSFDSEIGSLSWTNSANLSIKNSNFGQASNAADTGLVAPFTIYNLSSTIPICAQDNDIGEFGLLFTIDASTDTTSTNALVLQCNSSVESIRLTKTMSISGSHYIASSSVVSIGAQYWLTLSNGASLVIPTSFTLTSVYLNLSDPSSALYYAPGGMGSPFSLANLNGTMAINANAAIQLATGVSNFQVLLSAPTASSVLPSVGDVFKVFKSASVTYGSAFLYANSWKVQISSNSVSGDLSFAFAAQTCPSSCVNPSSAGCVSTIACSCASYWSGSACDIATSPLAVPTPRPQAPSTPSLLPEAPSTNPFGPGTNSTLPTGANTFSDLVVGGELALSSNTTVDVNGTLTINGKLKIAAKVTEVRSSGSKRHYAQRSSSASPAPSYCVINPSVAVSASQIALGSTGSIEISLDITGLSTDSSCTSPPDGDQLWNLDVSMLHSSSSTAISSGFALSVVLLDSASSRDHLTFSVDILSSSDTSTSSGIISRPKLATADSKSCATTTSTPGAIRLFVGPCPSLSPSKGFKWYYIVIIVVVVLVVAAVILIIGLRLRHSKARRPNPHRPVHFAPQAHPLQVLAAPPPAINNDDSNESDFWGAEPRPVRPSGNLPSSSGNIPSSSGNLPSSSGNHSTATRHSKRSVSSSEGQSEQEDLESQSEQGDLESSRSSTELSQYEKRKGARSIM